MAEIDAWGLVRRSWERQARGDEAEIAELADAQLDQLADSLFSLRSIAGAVSAVRKQVEREMGNRIGSDGWYVRHDSLFRFRPGYRWDIVDEALFWEWVKENVPAEKLSDLFNADDVKVSGLRAIADEATLNTFVLRREWKDDLRLQTIPRLKWPKWAEGLSDGDQGEKPARTRNSSRSTAE